MFACSTESSVTEFCCLVQTVEQFMDWIPSNIAISGKNVRKKNDQVKFDFFFCILCIGDIGHIDLSD